MKFYNPFKAHIVKFKNGKYSVRRRGGWFFSWWLYLNNPKSGADEEDYWWGCVPEYAEDHALYDSLQEAQDRLLRYLNPAPAPARPVVDDKGTRV